MNTDLPSKVVRPMPGRHIQDPVTGKLLEPMGELKPMTSFWCRRIVQGDAVVVKRKPADAAPQTQKAAK